MITYQKVNKSKFESKEGRINTLIFNSLDVLVHTALHSNCSTCILQGKFT